MASEMDNEPRYGRRSDAQPGTNPGTGAQGQTGPASGSTPWPQYGQVKAPANPAYGSYSGATGPASGQSGQGGAYGQYGQTGQSAQPAQGANPYQQGAYGAQNPQAGTAPQGPYGAQAPSQPYGQSPYGAPGYGYPRAGGPGYPAPAAPLPGRVGPILTMIGGVVVALIIAPVALFLGVLGGMNIGSLIESMDQVSSGSTVTVDSSGSYLVATESTNVYSCSLDGAGGVHQMEGVGKGTFYSSNLEPGSYTLTCEGEGTSQLYGITGLSADSITKAGMSGLIWGTVVGLLGVVLFIVGIVWLVRVNRKRQEIQRRAYGSSW
ncbi:hypothetical protein [Actinomyces culturomici]|uniref:hypothetical protein n=1 Tax=Actinomyces culturomici TaxID=1926276 RepID=UPI000E2046A4|nr:hypothetical protein [Actinomyces culturomici]